MKAFTSLEGLVVPLDRANVDTDLIIPKQFLNQSSAQGLVPICLMSCVTQTPMTSRIPLPSDVKTRFHLKSVALCRCDYSTRKRKLWLRLEP